MRILAVLLAITFPVFVFGQHADGQMSMAAEQQSAATAGLGQMVLNASNFLRTDVVIMGIVVIGGVAYLFDLLMRLVERKLVPWKGRT